MPMMVAGKKQLEKDNPPPTMVQLDTTPQVRGGAGLLGFIGGGAISAGKQLLSGASRLFRSFSNAPKQYIAKATGHQTVKAGKEIYGYEKGGKMTNSFKGLFNNSTKNVPVVGKPGQTVKVPKSSSTQQVSYVNPKISMTAAERRAAGY